MDFHRYVREHLPALTIAREPEIVDELALHLAELYREARASGLDHDDGAGTGDAALPKDARRSPVSSNPPAARCPT